MSERKEEKYMIDMSDYLYLRSILCRMAKPDKNAIADNKYSVRSLYFDSLDDDAFFDKVNGVNNREKFRIRLYDRNTGPIKLEKKSKISTRTIKDSVNISEYQTRQIINGDTSWMMLKDSALFREFYVKHKTIPLVPKNIVEYTREAFVFNNFNIRITFDSDIRSTTSSVDLFDFDIPMIKLTDKIILEVKYDTFIPGYIKDILNQIDKKTTSYSKYANGRISLID